MAQQLSGTLETDGHGGGSPGYFIWVKAKSRKMMNKRLSVTIAALTLLVASCNERSPGHSLALSDAASSANSPVIIGYSESLPASVGHIVNSWLADEHSRLGAAMQQKEPIIFSVLEETQLFEEGVRRGSTFLPARLVGVVRVSPYFLPINSDYSTSQTAEMPSSGSADSMTFMTEIPSPRLLFAKSNAKISRRVLISNEGIDCEILTWSDKSHAAVLEVSLTRVSGLRFVNWPSTVVETDVMLLSKAEHVIRSCYDSFMLGLSTVGKE